MTEVKITTYWCGICGYSMPASIDPYSDQFLTKYRGVQAGGCPSCATHPNPENRRFSQLVQATDLAEMVTTKTATEADLEAQEVPDLDARGNQKQVQTGTRWELQVDQSNGKVSSVPVPVYEPKMRYQTEKELSALKLQRNRNLDALESVAVKEVTPKVEIDPEKA